MVTRKMKNFEYAGISHAGSQAQNISHQQDSFETPNGFALVLAACEIEPDDNQCLSATAIERVRYYLENDLVDDPREAVQNALIYANGYLFEQRHKDNLTAIPGSCLCVLVRDQKVYYSWAGNVCAFLMAGKKWVPLTGTMPSFGRDDVDIAGDKGESGYFLGVEKTFVPAVCEIPLQPLDQDMLLLGTSPVCKFLREKDARRILLDSMPTQTKAMRLVNIVSQGEHQGSLALQLVSFYNLDQKERSYAGVAPAAVQGRQEEPSSEKYSTMSKVKIIAVVLGLLAVVYMIYDLFFYEPQPPSRIVTVDPVNGDLQDATVADARMPADVPYTVRSGDTWSSIYSRFQVCSWFIRNHSPNTDKFRETTNPVEGMQLMIPVKYSADPALNPEYHHEFTLDQVGSGCRNVNEEFRSQFEERAGSGS